MQFSDNEIIALLFGTSLTLSEPRGMYVLLQLVPAVNQKRSATNSGDGKTLTVCLADLVPRSRQNCAYRAQRKSGSLRNLSRSDPGILV